MKARTRWLTSRDIDYCCLLYNIDQLAFALILREGKGLLQK